MEKDEVIGARLGPASDSSSGPNQRFLWRIGSDLCEEGDWDWVTLGRGVMGLHVRRF